MDDGTWIAKTVILFTFLHSAIAIAYCDRIVSGQE